MLTDEEVYNKYQNLWIEYSDANVSENDGISELYLMWKFYLGGISTSDLFQYTKHSVKFNFACDDVSELKSRRDIPEELKLEFLLLCGD